ncbi:FAD binding domain-containing protein [Bimuria novae-zelandiae CBS 107.79]|uniref:FAD binding domain-containing protein n=1 Tax=Bimuria novae-zelandiae CBS 107.79 TaxID=1447943 RepID=A0A6A5UWW4_9PLEO|nr:FAD binding domain-containing protein [Bimuria novae-zelandiae CBS 107.79]
MTFTSEFQGNWFLPRTAAYTRTNDLYATSTYGKERDMNPGEILQPTGIEDIQNVVKYANYVGKPIAIRSGGHQYSGASSTGPNGIQLDLKPTFRRPKLDLKLIHENNGKVYIRSSVSWTLSEFYDFLLDHGVFLPTGQCATVCLGGHVQTGGYGMLARSFGLFGDYVVELEIVDHSGNVVKVTKVTHPDLFYGFLGGSPGNMGVLTHFKVEVQEDRKHQDSKGLWVAFPYRQDTLKSLLDILVEKGEDPNLERNYDLNVNILSRQMNLLDLFPGSESELKEKLPNEVHDGINNVADLLKFKYALIIVYAQWVNFGTDAYSPDLFNRIRSVPHIFKFGKETPQGYSMSKITSWWLFRSAREFPYPYVKRTKTTKSTMLSKDGWSEWFSGRIDEVLSDEDNGLWVSAQLQVMGGTNSMFWKNTNDSTAYSWRDATVVGTWDIFYQDTQEKADKWQDENDKGSLIYFSEDDCRLLWGSYGDWDMKKVWMCYYDPATYQKLQQIRKQADPKGVFTANPFCVEAAK